MSIEKVYGKDDAGRYNGKMMAVGRVGERLVMAWLKTIPQIADVEDVSKSKRGDAMITWADGRKALAEIKTDKHIGDSGNMVYETVRHYCGGISQPAWPLTSAAEWLFYLDLPHGIVYATTMSSFRRAARERAFMAADRTASLRHFVLRTSRTTATEGWLLPANSLDECTMYDVNACNACDGAGGFHDVEVCDYCGGTGHPPPWSAS